MSNHLTELELAAYRQSTLPPLELLAADDHLAECAACRQKLAAPVAPVLAAQTWHTALFETTAHATPHLAYEQIVVYLEATVSATERHSWDSHCLVCEECAERVADVRVATMRVVPHRNYTPPTTLARRLRAHLQPHPATWRTAFAALSLLVLAVAGASWATRHMPQQSVSVALAQWPAMPPDWVTPSGGASQRLSRTRVSAPQKTISEPAHAGTNAPLTLVSAPQKTISETPPKPAERATLTPKLTVSEQFPVVQDGGRAWALDARGELLAAADVPERYRMQIAQFLQGKALFDSSDKLPLAPGSLMGRAGANATGLLNPTRGWLRSTRPTLSWAKVDGATHYEVVVSTADLRTTVVTSPALTTTRWQVPVPLSRGITYLWQVRVVSATQEIMLPAPNVPEAQFSIIGAQEAQELAYLEKRFPRSHLLRGLGYARAGLCAAARREFTALHKANPKLALLRRLEQRSC